GFDQAFSKASHGKKPKKYSSYIVDELKKRGYNVAYKMINFADYGVPQRRIRFILFASKILDPNTFFEELERHSRFFLHERDLPQTVTIKSAISDLEEKNGTTVCPDSIHFLSGLYGSSKTEYQRFCRCGRRKGQIPNSHRFANHNETTKKRFQELLELNIPDKNISEVLGKEYGIKKNCFSVLAADLPSPTLTSNPDDHIHYSEPRTLTVREYARIQSFPDWFEFKGKYTTGGDCRKTDVPRYTQIGNAIPPLFSEQVGEVLIKMINGIK
ncbi:MAG: DNA cytosine methyltransferase, partial [Clostridia bacterium]|nr:DNA cytosine methyltransferase [Clostridia bacterium]